MERYIHLINVRTNQKCFPKVLQNSILEIVIERIKVGWYPVEFWHQFSGLAASWLGYWWKRACTCFFIVTNAAFRQKLRDTELKAAMARTFLLIARAHLDLMHSSSDAASQPQLKTPHGTPVLQSFVKLWRRVVFPGFCLWPFGLSYIQGCQHKSLGYTSSISVLGPAIFPTLPAGWAGRVMAPAACPNTNAHCQVSACLVPVLCWFSPVS